MNQSPMPDQNSKVSQRSLPDEMSRHVSWVIDPKRGMLLPLTGIWILALDWLLFSSNLLTAGLATPVIVAIGFVLGAVGTLVLQKMVAKDSLWKALLKALVAGIVVGIPWPLTGSLIGGWILLAAGIKKPAGKATQPS